MEDITKIFEWEYLLPATILIFLFFVMVIIGISICKLFKNVGLLKGALFILTFLLLTLQMVILENRLLGIEKICREIILYLASITSVVIMMSLFSRRNKIENDDFIILVGITMLIQTIISMMISSSDSYSFTIKFIHGAWYITLPAFLIYEVSNNKKDFLKLNNKLNILQKDMQKSCSNSVKKENTHKCIFLDNIKRKNK